MPKFGGVEHRHEAQGSPGTVWVGEGEGSRWTELLYAFRHLARPYC